MIFLHFDLMHDIKENFAVINWRNPYYFILMKFFCLFQVEINLHSVRKISDTRFVFWICGYFPVGKYDNFHVLHKCKIGLHRYIWIVTLVFLVFSPQTKKLSLNKWIIVIS